MKLRIIALAFLAAMAGCSSPASNPMMTMLNHVAHQASDTGQAQLDPGFHYLRVMVDGKVVFLASDTPNVNDPHVSSAWYSADREILRFRNGRLVGAIGTATEWRNVVVPELPAWSEIPLTANPIIWTRTRDVMPGYRFGVQDSVALKRISPPGASQLVGMDAHVLTWYEERVESSGNGLMREDGLPPARYAVDLRNQRERVVYGEACVSAKLCFTWQQWPPQVE